MIAVVMEPSLRDPRQWEGVVGGKLGGKLYVDLADDGAQFERGIERLLAEMRAVLAEDAGGRQSPAPTSSGSHPQPTTPVDEPWPPVLVMDGQPFALQGWNGEFKRTAELVNGRPAYRRADVRLAGGFLPILAVELWWQPSESHWVLHREVDKAHKHVLVSLHSNRTPVGRWERGVSVKLPAAAP